MCTNFFKHFFGHFKADLNISIMRKKPFWKYVMFCHFFVFFFESVWLQTCSSAILILEKCSMWNKTFHLVIQQIEVFERFLSWECVSFPINKMVLLQDFYYDIQGVLFHSWRYSVEFKKMWKLWAIFSTVGSNVGIPYQ